MLGEQKGQLSAEPIALVDMDGTLCDYSGAIAKALGALRSPEEPEIDPERDELPPHVEARRKLVSAVPGFWRNLERLPLGFDVLHELEALKFQPYILSKGPSSNSLAWMEKVDWCRAHIPHVPIIVTEDKGLVYGKVLVDDWPPYIERWLKWRPRGLVVVPAQPWNLDIEARFPARCVRYDGNNLAQVRERLVAIRATAMTAE